MSEATKDTLKISGLWISICVSIFLLEKFVIHQFLGNFILDNAIVYVPIIWILFNMLTGYIQARNNYYRQASTLNDSYNEHIALGLEAAFVFVPLMIILHSWQSDLLLLGMRIFWHDGMFYLNTHKLNPTIYLKGFFDQSTTSTSWWDRKHLTGPIFRTILFIGSLTIYIIYNYVYGN